MEDICDIVGPKGCRCSDIGVIMESHSNVPPRNNCTVGDEASSK